MVAAGLLTGEAFFGTESSILSFIDSLWYNDDGSPATIMGVDDFPNSGAWYAIRMTGLILINVIVGALIYILFKRAGVIGGRIVPPTRHECEPMTNQPSTPAWVWGLLVGAVIGVSSAGALFQHVDAVPPLLRASWRLQLTSIVLAPLALWQWRSTDEHIKEQYWSRSAWLLMGASGVALAAHFGAWVASLDETTLTHSLLFVTRPPPGHRFGHALTVKPYQRCSGRHTASKALAH